MSLIKTILLSYAIVNLMFIAGIHFYWASGGKQWADRVLPQFGEKKVLQPNAFMTIFVATVFLTFTLIVANQLLRVIDTANYGNILTLAIGFIFIARAIGDFKFVGFGKKVTNTTFAYYDTKIFTPYSLSIGLAVVIAYLL